jgi:hypothetical protein
MTTTTLEIIDTVEILNEEQFQQVLAERPDLVRKYLSVISHRNAPGEETVAKQWLNSNVYSEADEV